MRRDYAKNRQVAEAFYRHTLQAARGSGLPVLEVNDARQHGSRFGTRLANAFAGAFVRGYEHVIAVGSDCPRLHEVDWHAVAEHLERGAPVLGPTPDYGGVYLIGLSRAQFSRQAFAMLPWQSQALFPSLARHLSERSGTAPVLLAPRSDVNSHRDLVALVCDPTALPSGLVTRLRLVLGNADYATGSEESVSEANVSRCRSRAPPSHQQGRRTRRFGALPRRMVGALPRRTA